MSGLFCPVCKRKNHLGEVYCKFCGASLTFAELAPSTTTRRIDPDSLPLSDAQEQVYIASLAVPDEGIALYLTDNTKPIAIREEREIILGRKQTVTKNEAIMDLTPFGGYEYGVSHRHAMIRRIESGYEISDLDSTNGTYLDRKRMVPATPYLLVSGSRIRLGKLNLYTIYKEILKKA